MCTLAWVAVLAAPPPPAPPPRLNAILEPALPKGGKYDLRGPALRRRFCEAPFPPRAANRTIGMLHIPKTGTTFMNSVVHWACEGLPATLSAADMVKKEDASSGPPTVTNAWAQLDRELPGGLKASCFAHRLIDRGRATLVQGPTPWQPTSPGWRPHVPLREYGKEQGHIVGMFRRPAQRLFSAFHHAGGPHGVPPPDRARIQSGGVEAYAQFCPSFKRRLSSSSGGRRMADGGAGGHEDAHANSSTPSKAKGKAPHKSPAHKPAHNHSDHHSDHHSQPHGQSSSGAASKPSSATSPATPPAEPAASASKPPPSIQCVANKQCAYVLGRPCSGGADVREAVLRIRRGFAFVGLTEHWAESVCLFHHVLGAPPLPVEFESSRAYNGTAKRSGWYDEGTRPAEAERLDAVLHAFAQHAFLRQIHERMGLRCALRPVVPVGQRRGDGTAARAYAGSAAAVEALPGLWVPQSALEPAPGPPELVCSSAAERA